MVGGGGGAWLESDDELVLVLEVDDDDVDAAPAVLDPLDLPALDLRRSPPPPPRLPFRFAADAVTEVDVSAATDMVEISSVEVVVAVLEVAPPPAMLDPLLALMSRINGVLGSTDPRARSNEVM